MPYGSECGLNSPIESLLSGLAGDSTARRKEVESTQNNKCHARNRLYPIPVPPCR